MMASNGAPVGARQHPQGLAAGRGRAADLRPGLRHRHVPADDPQGREAQARHLQGARARRGADRGGRGGRTSRSRVRRSPRPMSTSRGFWGNMKVPTDPVEPVPVGEPRLAAQRRGRGRRRARAAPSSGLRARSSGLGHPGRRSSWSARSRSSISSSSASSSTSPSTRPSSACWRSGLSFCIIAGHMDLSIESVMAFAAMLAAWLTASRGSPLRHPAQHLADAPDRPRLRRAGRPVQRRAGGPLPDQRLHRHAGDLHLGARASA